MFILKRQGTYTVIKVGTGVSYTLVAFSRSVPVAFIFIPNDSSMKAAGTMVRVSVGDVDRHGRKHIEKFAEEQAAFINHNQVATSLYHFDTMLEAAMKNSTYDHVWTPGSPKSEEAYYNSRNN